MKDSFNNLHNKILFFFMPQNVTFFKASKDDDINTTILKSICPYFYWCSAHEFKDFKLENRFLFQYQVYTIENRKIVPGEVIQEWYENKNSIKLSIMNFIEKWEDHNRNIVSKYNHPKEISNIDNLLAESQDQSYNLDNFANFAQFVAKSIINFQPLYIKECEDKNFDFLQKKFWENMALHYQSIILNFNNQQPKKRIVRKPKKQKIKKNKNEASSNKRSK